MKPEDETLIREIALSLLSQRPAGERAPQEIVITYRKHEDYENFIRQIADLERQLKEAQYQAARMSLYAEENFVLFDQLRQAYRDMSQAGLDVSYITLDGGKSAKTGFLAPNRGPFGLMLCVGLGHIKKSRDADP